MILAKCKCGCFFSVRDAILEHEGDQAFKCQNCGASLQMNKEGSLDNLRINLNMTGFSVRVIPDDAQIDTRFPL